MQIEYAIPWFFYADILLTDIHHIKIFFMNIFTFVYFFWWDRAPIRVWCNNCDTVYPNVLGWLVDCTCQEKCCQSCPAAMLCIIGSQTALSCVQQCFPHSHSLLPAAGSEKETGEASPCRNIHEHAKAWITLKSCYSLHSLVCVCQCVEHPSICSKYPNASSLICMMRETTLCAFAFIPYLVCRSTLWFGMLSVLSLMFWWCFAEESSGDSSLLFCQWCCFLWMRFRVEWKAKGLHCLPLKNPIAFRSQTTQEREGSLSLRAHGQHRQWEASVCSELVPEMHLNSLIPGQQSPGEGCAERESKKCQYHVNIYHLSISQGRRFVPQLFLLC